MQINTIWLIEVGGLRIVHTGDNGPIDDRIQAELGQVDLLMLPIDAQFHILPGPSAPHHLRPARR